jgi:mRNA interferase RelE/StbE
MVYDRGGHCHDRSAELIFSGRASEDIANLPTDIARRITIKMRWYAQQADPLSFAKPLKGNYVGSYRFRVGDYRVVVNVRHGDPAIIEVLAVLHCREAYQL